MTIIYEVNPPKIPSDSNPKNTEIDSMLSKLKERIESIASFCDGIHVTDSVLGINRISPITTGKLLKKNHPNLKITISARVRDKSIADLEQIVDNAISLELDGILILKGDPAKDNPIDSGLIPSQVVKYFVDSQYTGKLEFFLSLPSRPDFKKIQKKVDARPSGFMTQVIHSIKQVKRISDELRPQGFRVIPCVLLPSEKNSSSAQFLNLDWSEYKDNPVEFIQKVNDVAGDVLITSPSDFTFAKETIQNL